MSLRLLASVACIAVTAASGAVVWHYIGGTSSAQAQAEVTRADLCRIARDLQIANEFGFNVLETSSEQVTNFQLQMCNGEEDWPPPPYPSE